LIKFLFIESDNKIALKRIDDKSVKLIYSDLPYNTKNSLSYEDSKTHQQWKEMIYPCLKESFRILQNNGFICLSIDDNEIYNLKLMMDKIFGESNFVATLVWHRNYSPKMNCSFFSKDHEYLLVYKRSKNSKINKEIRQADENYTNRFNHEDLKGKYRRRSLRKEGKGSLKENAPTLFYPLTSPDGSEVWPIKPDGTQGHWRWSKKKVEKEKEFLEWVKKNNHWEVYVKQYFSKTFEVPPSTVWSWKEVGHYHSATQNLQKEIGDVRAFESPKPIGLLLKILDIFTDDGDVVLDFFAGTASTAIACSRHKNDLRFIGIQSNEKIKKTDGKFVKISEIAIERIKKEINGEDLEIVTYN